MALKIEYKIGPQHTITLDETRELVETTEGWNGKLTLDIKVDNGNQREPSTRSIAVRKQ